MANIKPMVWANHDWVTPMERRRGVIASSLTIGALVPGAILYVAGLIALSTGKSSVVTNIILITAGLLLLFTVALSARRIHPHRRRPALEAGTTVFHISPASWDVGQQVVLAVARSRRTQALAERRGRPGIAKVVYFFPQRPTIRHARGQTLAGRRHAPRHLYELELQRPVSRLYERGSSCATPDDVTVIIRTKHALSETWKKESRSAAAALL